MSWSILEMKIVWVERNESDAFRESISGELRWLWISCLSNRGDESFDEPLPVSPAVGLQSRFIISQNDQLPQNASETQKKRQPNSHFRQNSKH